MCVFIKAAQVILKTNAQELISNSEATQHWEWAFKK